MPEITPFANLTPEEDAADSLESYNGAMRALGEQVKAGMPVPAFLLGQRMHNRDSDAIEIGALYRQARSSAADSVHYALEAGMRLIAKKSQMRHGEWLPWLAANGDLLNFDHPRTAQKLMLAASKYAVDGAFDEAEAIRINRQIWDNAPLRGTAGTGDNEWFTPTSFIDAAQIVLEGIDVDPATHALAQQYINAPTFYTREDDGLVQEWRGTVWLNPPYARDEIGRFVDKLIAERACGNTTAAIMLTHNYTDTDWFHRAEAAADLLCFTRGRIKFIDDAGDECNPTQGQCFFYYGPNPERFRELFSAFGFIR